MKKNSSIKKRAMNDEAKSKRKQAILDSAKELYIQEKNVSVPIYQIAQNAGLAKGTVYLYFKTREAMDLEILRQSIAKSFDKIDSVIDLKTGPEDFLKVLCTFASDFLIVTLGSRYNLLMEKCGDYHTIVKFKEYLNTRIEKTASGIRNLFPKLELREIIELLIGSFSLMIGLCQMAEPAFIAKEVLDSRGLDNLKLDFEKVFPKLLSNLWSEIFQDKACL